MHIHGAEYLAFYDGLTGQKKSFVKEFFRHADLVLALSDSWKRELEARFSMGACETLHNGVDPVPFRGGGRRPGGAPGFLSGSGPAGKAEGNL